MAPTADEILANYAAQQGGIVTPSDLPAAKLKQYKNASITQDILDPLIEDYNSEKFTSGLNERQNAFRQQVIEIFQDPETLQKADADKIVGQLIKTGNRVGGVDDIVARATRDVLRLKGEELGDEGLDEVFAAYKIKTPPLDDIKFEGYDSLDDEHEKIDGWAAQAKANYSLKTKANHPELLAHRDEVFQKIDDTAKGLKRKVGATDSGFVDFVGRLAEGGASMLDSVGLDSVGNFIRKHSATNPEWDADTSAIVGQALGQGITQLAAFAGITAATVASGGTALLGAGLATGTAALSNLNATQSEREGKVLESTGSEGLAYASSHDTSAYAEAGIDTLIDVSLMGAGKLGAGKVAKKLLGPGGRKIVGEGFAESLSRTAGKLDNLKKTAGLAGDVIWNGTKEGATEVLQGAISDTSVGNYTNMKDKFDPYDIRNRAADFIGGVAGGVGITLANNFILPANRLPKEEQPPKENYDARLRQSGAAFSNADNVSTASNAATDFVQTAAAAATQEILDGQEVELPQLPTPDVEPVDKFDFKSMYENSRTVLGDLINHPTVQGHLEAGLDLFNKIRAYKPAARPKDSEATETTTDTAVAPTPVETKTADAVATAEAAITDPTASVEAPLDAFETALKGFPTSDVTPLEGGGSRYSFSLTGKGAKTKGNLAALTDAGLSVTDIAKTDNSSPGLSVRNGGEALRLDRNTYTVDTNAEGVPVSFTTTRADGTVTKDESINTRERLASRVQGIQDRQKVATSNLADRTNLGLTSNPSFRNTVPDNITAQLPQGAQNFVNKIVKTGERGGGYPAQAQAAADEYVDSGKAFKDLTDAGLSDDQASSYLEKVRKLNTPEYRTARINGKVNPKQKVRREALTALHLDLAKSLSDPVALEASVREGYAPNKQDDALRALGLTEKAAPVAAPIVQAAPAAEVAPLSANPDLQRLALANKFGEEKVDAVLEQAKSNPEIASAIDKITNDHLQALGVDPTSSVDEALKKADIASQFNKGSFKLRPARPLNRSLFSLGRIFDKLGINQQTSTDKTLFEQPVAPPVTSYVDEEGNTVIEASAPLPPRQTGRIDFNTQNPKGIVSIASPVLRGQQGELTGWHELGEKALSDNPNFATTLSSLTGFSPSTLANELQSVSDNIRAVPTLDPHEHLVDVIAEYLYDTEAFRTNHGELAAALDHYIDDPRNSNTALVDVAQTVSEEDAIPDSEKLQDLADQTAANAAAANEALAGRNTDKRPFLERVKDIVRDAQIKIFNSAANLQEAARELAKNTTYAGAANTLNRYFEVFKNRQQLAAVAQATVKKSFDRLAKMGITLDQVNDYLGNNRIVNEKSFWEQQIAKTGLTGKGFSDILTGSDSITSLILGDPVLEQMVNDLLGQGDDLVDADALTTVLNELSAKAYAETLDGKIRGELGHISDPVLKASVSAAFDPTITVGIKNPVEVIGHTARGNLQNTANVNRQVAQAALDQLRGSLSPEQYAALEKFSTDTLAPITRLAVNELLGSGAIDQKTADFYLGNADNYVTFQLASALQEDPFVDSAVRRQEGMDAARAGPLQATMLKISGIRARAAVQNFSNQIAGTYYDLDNASGSKNIKPLFATASRGPGTNQWVKNNKAQFPGVQEIPLAELVAKKKVLDAEAKKSRDDVSYVIAAADGDYVLHEIADSTIDGVLHPKNFTQQGELLQTLNGIQTWKRAILTTNNPAFAIRSVVRAGTNLYRNRQSVNRTAQPTWGELGKAILSAPIAGIPLNKQDRQLMWHAYNQALQYTRNSGDPDRTLGSIDEFFDNATTYQDLINNPRAIEILVRQGYLPASVGEDLASGVTSETAGPTPGGLFSSSNQSELDGFIHGVQGKKNILRKAHDYVSPKSETAGKLTAGLATGVETFLAKTRDLNNSLELGEKYMGILAYMQDGLPFEQAVVKANLNFGNPDAKGGGSAKADIAPFILYSTSVFNGMRVLGSSIIGAKNPLQDQRAAKAIGAGARNALVLAGLPAAMYAVARATGSGDDEAKKQADVVDRLINNIPEADRRSGMAIPIAFRDPRTRDYHFPMATGIDEVDPSWTTVYLNLPYDPVTGVFQSFVAGAQDLFDSKVGTAAVAGNFLSNSLGQSIPSGGPLINAGVALSQAARGVNPSNLFTGQNIASDEDFERGGLQLGMKYAQYLANEFVPLIPGPGKSSFDKTKIFEPTGFSILDSIPQLLKLGIVKESNFGQIQQNRKQLGTTDDFAEKVKADSPDEAKNYINRTNELQREATLQLKLAKDRLLAQGESPSNSIKRAADLLPPALQKELLTAQHWRREFYDRLKEKAEIALRDGDTTSYEKFLQDMKESIPGSKVVDES